MVEQLTQEQFDRIEVVVVELARRENPQAMALAKLIVGKPQVEKRRLILGTWGKLFEFMLSVQMAMNSERSIEEVRAALRMGG